MPDWRVSGGKVKVGGEEREFSKQREEYDPMSRGQRKDGMSGELRIMEYDCDARRTSHK